MRRVSTFLDLFSIHTISTFFEGIWNPTFNNLIFLHNIVPPALHVYIPGGQWSIKYSSIGKVFFLNIIIQWGERC